MNSTVVPPNSGHWLTTTERIGGFAYGLGVSVGILVLITTIFLASYYCTRTHISASPTTTPTTRRRQRQSNETFPSNQERFHFDDTQNDTVVIEVLGLNEEVIKSFPKLVYEEARVSYKLQSDSTTTSCCSICLADYKKMDMIRVLPDCNHLFHDYCVDPWLRLHPTCPLCRTSPFPSPAMTPVADVVP